MTSHPTQTTASDAGFCLPWTSKAGVAMNDRLGAYTDADLAADMNALSFAERQVLEEDIHGVADKIEETPEFIAKKVEEMVEAMAKLNTRQQQALDRAVFLRPSLAEGVNFHLIFLRARRFRPVDAAKLMGAYFQGKRDLFGDDLLIHRITWDDLHANEQAIFRTGAFRLSHDRLGRGVVIMRLSKFDLSESIVSAARCTWYVLTAVYDDPVMQQKGIVTVADYGGKWLASHLQLMRLASAFPTDAIPIHYVCLHILYSESALYDLIQTIRSMLPKESRTRVRLHFGSSLEMDYALRTFGINTSRQLFDEWDPLPFDDNTCDDSIEEDIRRRQQLDDEWRRSEAPYRDPVCPIALFPNPQDIIMGRSKAIATT